MNATGGEPSAPPLEISQLNLGSTDLGPLESPMTTIELTISATNLLNRDSISKSDPVCILYVKDGKSMDFNWREVDRTECIKNDLNPSWATKIVMQYKVEERQMLKFMIYDLDGTSQSLERHDFLGKMECVLGEIVSSRHGKFSRPLHLPALYQNTKSNLSQLTVVAEVLGNCRKVLTMKVQFNMNIKSSVFGVSNASPCLVISKQLDDKSWVLVYKTDFFDRTITIRLSSLTSGGNLERPIKWQLFHKKQNSKWTDVKLIGEFTTNYLHLQEHYRMREGPMKLYNPLNKRRQTNAGGDQKSLIHTGTMEICMLNIEDRPSFLDYLANGLELSVTIAIDFTASNRDPVRHTSLHYRHGGIDNPYVLAIKTVGEVIDDYSSKRYAAFGFGAKGFPAANRVSHSFPINFKQSNPWCDGIGGVLDSYYRVIKRIRLSGPTYFAPVIHEHICIAKNNMERHMYNVLLILTDGIICDPVGTRDAIIQAASLPISIIIIGIGDEDFKEMEKLDCDGSLLRNANGECAPRDIVQFVELKKFVNFKSINPIGDNEKLALAQAVLAELPSQVCDWMSMFAK